jgi:rare lipoprotein A
MASAAGCGGVGGRLRRGDVMGWQSAALIGGRMARAGALVLGALVLAHCSAGNKDSKYSAKVVEDGEPVPKGGGNYKVGKPYSINGRTYFPSENMSYRADGIASWYGADFHGRLTANGEVYDMHGISAAHTTMPLPSYARVTNLANGRSIVVRVNDRGPYARNRIIDLSVGTAKALKFHGQGLASVRVEYLGRAPLAGSDDGMLMATLREGSPAPAPSNVMVASAKPFLSGLGGAATRNDDAPLPPERPFLLGAGSNRPAGQARNAEVTATTNKPPARSVVRSPAAEPDDAPSAPPTAGFAPMRGQGAAGLMSGRGLY